ncbi:MAG: sugar MFS transporter [Gammaproteobacteria bacterium]|uniref:sugar MFS transporter n=1 Tax=Shewanella baltica TaxID=62322 RepID=UPI001C730713|nr:sugar MFS transporter [uncultured Shewanella sp.]EGT3627203.1 sugar MFS transporter [Morganella morganii]MBU1394017.1 sugar MFS transporter [Gammaproteobacteria bacterium]QYX66718.1 sugar MFS transporter [Shewanella putrefaciens]MBU1479550.1 sugar MFS transporter [Gammaproteobacteria bacterium]MBU2003616.1 sugar MFS transporter [Gammaproteobacteria bacterium]
MASSINTGSYSSNAGENGSGSYRFALISLTSLFFMWGFITCLNDILIPHLKAVFSLNYTQAMLIQFCFFGAYFLVSIPAGNLVKKLGYQKGIVTGLVIASIGCALFYPAATLATYNLFLGALFVLASGITILQVAANPYVNALGSSETASSRLNLTQAFNALGTTVAPFFGAMLILSVASSVSSDLANASAEAEVVKLPYLLLSGALAILALIFAKLDLPVIREHDHSVQGEVQTHLGKTSALQSKHLVLGAVGIFVYVGAEVSIGSFLVNFLGESHIAGMPEAEAAHYIAYYWGGAMVGRFIGSVVMQKVPAGSVLAFNAFIAALLVLVAMTSSGSIAMWAILGVGLFNSIMFPTIFSLALRDLGPHTSQGSGILCLAIVGGAILPLFQGMLADNLGVQHAFILPVICYGFILFYGAKGSKM